jgi:N-acetyl-alpha-D-glucosaminyl L-malate synthase BshA
MRIGMVCYPTFGGSGVVATELGKALAAKGHEIHFITYDQPARLGSFQTHIFYHEVRVSDYPLFDYPPYELVLASKLVEVARNRSLDLVHVHYAIPHASAAYMAREILAKEGVQLPVVTTLHGTDITLLGRDPSFEPVISFAINQSDVVTAVSQSLRSDTFKLFGVNREIEVVPNFYCASHFQITPNEEFRKAIAPNGEPILTHISNFRPVKRISDVVELFRQVRESLPAKLLMVGDGPDRAAAEQRITEWGLQGDVVFLGKVKNPVEALMISDLFLLPSESESFGLAALEAMAAGVPVIGSNAGGMPEVIRHGVSGLLSDVGSTRDLARNAIYLLESKERMAQFSQQAKERALEFRIDRVMPKYEALYNKALRRD